MRFGQRIGSRLPDQDSQQVILQAERFQRAQWAQQKWAEGAKKAVDYLEGRQWTHQQLAKMARQKRPALTFNIIAPLVRLILGYQTNNRTDIVFQPGNDARATEEVAKILTQLEKNISDNNTQAFTDTEVFLDGITAGRGYYRDALDFEDNDLGEIRNSSLDPFQVYPDPDGDTYDLNESCSFVQHAKMVSIDEIEHKFGENVAGLVKPFTNGQTPLGNLFYQGSESDTPRRYFGGYEDSDTVYWDRFHSVMGDFVDTHRKNIRILETEHKVYETRNVFIDLETGDKKVIPKDWKPDRIEKVLYHAENIGNPLTVERRRIERTQWTTICGDVVLHNRPSPYDRFSITGFFPYFRRGETRGVVADMIDPQNEKNKNRSLRVEQTMKTANGGWLYHENSLDPEQERNLRNFGAAPGVLIKYKGDVQNGKAVPPQQINPAAQQTAYKQLETDSDQDIRSISGINESALGELDRVQSGRAIEARQRQAVIAIQLYMDNFKRTKTLVGRNHLSLIQNHYTEQRIYRVTGEDGKLEQFQINELIAEPDNGAKRILNNVTVGKYTVKVDEQPLSATFANAQFEEMLTLLEKMGPAIGPFIPAFADLMVDMSSMPRKDEWIERFQALTGQMAGSAPMGHNGGPAMDPAQQAAPQQALPAPPQQGV